jgi:hypothetical protein
MLGPVKRNINPKPFVEKSYENFNADKKTISKIIQNLLPPAKLK